MSFDETKQTASCGLDKPDMCERINALNETDGLIMLIKHDGSAITIMENLTAPDVAMLATTLMHAMFKMPECPCVRCAEQVFDALRSAAMTALKMHIDESANEIQSSMTETDCTKH